MATPHNQAEKGQIAKTVLMPGDPLRAKYIAENFLTEVQQFNEVRNMYGYTGKYQGREVSVMGSGMGMPSMGIYSYELFNFFGVDNIIRVGTAGAINKAVHVRDIVLAMGACTNSNYCSQFELNGSFAPIADFKILLKAAEICANKNFAFHVGNVITSDTFYSAQTDMNKKWADMGVLAVEMETAALYINAARAKKRALALFTVSDSLVTGEQTTADERQSSFTDMIELALETAVSE